MSNKTYKRETAVAILLVLLCFFILGVWIERAFEVATFLTTPSFLFAGGAFGLDSVSKQIKGDR
jgi:hypothetical protein